MPDHLSTDKSPLTALLVFCLALFSNVETIPSCVSCLVSVRGGGAEQFGFITNLKQNSAAAKLQASPGQHHRQLSISLHYSAALILLPVSASLSLLWHLNTQPEEKRFTHIFKSCARSVKPGCFILCFACRLVNHP